MYATGVIAMCICWFTI